jgi:hypothetical protein
MAKAEVALMRAILRSRVRQFLAASARDDRILKLRFVRNELPSLVEIGLVRLGEPGDSSLRRAVAISPAAIFVLARERLPRVEYVELIFSRAAAEAAFHGPLVD